MSSSFQQPDTFADSGASPTDRISTQIMVSALVLLLCILSFVFVLYLYARRFLAPSAPVAPLRRSLSRFAFAPEAPAALLRGLDPTLLSSLPVTSHQTSQSKDGDPLDCAVCLSEVLDGEKIRVLPNCRHGFHVECIDMWFHSHSNCPLCRTDVEAPATSRESSETRGRELVIEIPSRGGGLDGFVSPMTPLPTSRLPVEESKSPASGRFRSMRRLWSRGRGIGGGDVEQGFEGCSSESSSRTPKVVKNS